MKLSKLLKESELSDNLKNMIEGLIDDTIVPAFYEDMSLRTGDQQRKALKYLIEQLQIRLVK